MNRKHNPMLSLVALLLAALILVLTCTGCATNVQAATPQRFQIEFTGRVEALELYIITDTETGVQYMFVDGVNCGSLTVLLPGEG